MMRNYRFAVGAAVCVCVFTCYSQGWCQERPKDKITWDDLTGPDSEKSLPVMPTVHTSGPVVSPRESGEEARPEPVMPEPAMPEVAVAQDPKTLSAEPAQQAASVQEAAPAQEIKSAPVVSPAPEVSPAAHAQVAPSAVEPAQKKEKPAVKKAPAGPAKEKDVRSKKPRKEPTVLERATAITDENPATARDTFVVNPNRE